MPRAARPRRPTPPPAPTPPRTTKRTMQPMADLEFIDADGHIIEPPHDLPKFAPKGYEDKVFHVDTDADGKDWVVVGDRRIDADVFAFAAAGGLPVEEREAAHRGELRYSDMRSGGWDAQMRMAD